jgi:hypothetical protein
MIHLSGTSGLLEALALMRQLTNAMGPSLRAIVIKSACMQEYARRCLVAHEYLKEVRSREGQGDRGVETVDGPGGGRQDAPRRI